MKEEQAEQPAAVACADVPCGPAAAEDGKVFSLDGDWGDLGASWSQEEEEERCEEERPEERACSAGRVRPGRRERAAVRGEEAVLGEEGTDHPLDAAATALFRATAARANYLALDQPEVAFAAKELPADE